MSRLNIEPESIYTPNIATNLKSDEPMNQHTTLRVGGSTDHYWQADNVDELGEFASQLQVNRVPFTLIGEGSNVCVADAGVRGLVIQNRCCGLKLAELTEVDCGFNLMRFSFLAMRDGWDGLAWAVGIPGTVGGALVSNAGAYRGNIGPLVQSLEVVENGIRKWVGPEWMEFSYRDSRLRRSASVSAVLLRVKLKLSKGDRELIRNQMRDFQRQRISKQPWGPSAGSFFKNVNSPSLAESLTQLPSALKQAGVVPAAVLTEACGCKGLRVGGAEVSLRHANFVVNSNKATASDIRNLTQIMKQRVFEQFGVVLEEEVLFLGDWKSEEWI